MKTLKSTKRRLQSLLVGGCMALLSAHASAGIIGAQFIGAGDSGLTNPNAWTMTGFGFTSNRLFWELSAHGTPVAATAFVPSVLFATFRITTDRSISDVQTTACLEAFSGPCGKFGNDAFGNTAAVGAGVEFAGQFSGGANDFDPSDTVGDLGVSGNTLDINPTSYVVHLEKIFGRGGNSSSSTVNVNAEICFKFNPDDCLELRDASLTLSTNPTQGITTAAPSLDNTVPDGGEAALGIAVGAALLAPRRRKR